MPPPIRQVVLRRRHLPGLAAGHPWIWRDTVAHGLEDVHAGEEVQVRLADGTALGRGIADPGSPIAVRLWTRGEQPIDEQTWRDRIVRACELRARLFGQSGVDAFRVVNGEGDRMPGLVVDRYAQVAVARADGEGASARMTDLVEALWPTLQSWGVRTLVHRVGRKGDVPRLEVLRGEAPPDSVLVKETFASFVVDLIHGQKTGAFLDQRENRSRVFALTRAFAPRRVLNLFSYAGGFSLAAALAGAQHVTSVDVSTGAHATAQQSFRAAGVDSRAHDFVTADVRSFLDDARRRRETWDLVVSDPPSFAPSEKALPRALSAYRSLHRACAEVLATPGMFCAASCSSHVDTNAFLATLDDAAIGRCDMRLLELHGAGPDHPALPSFPEGRYLKFAVLA